MHASVAKEGSGNRIAIGRANRVWPTLGSPARKPAEESPLEVVDIEAAAPAKAFHSFAQQPNAARQHNERNTLLQNEIRR